MLNLRLRQRRCSVSPFIFTQTPTGPVSAHSSVCWNALPIIILTNRPPLLTTVLFIAQLPSFVFFSCENSERTAVLLSESVVASSAASKTLSEYSDYLYRLCCSDWCFSFGVCRPTDFSQLFRLHLKELSVKLRLNFPKVRDWMQLPVKGPNGRTPTASHTTRRHTTRRHTTAPVNDVRAPLSGLNKRSHKVKHKVRRPSAVLHSQNGCCQNAWSEPTVVWSLLLIASSAAPKCLRYKTTQFLVYVLFSQPQRWKVRNPPQRWDLVVGTVSTWRD